MIEHTEITHHIQKHILHTLMSTETARFRDLRPPKADTNLYSYHLKLLLKRGLIKKTDSGYTLTELGMNYVDRVSDEKFSIRRQSKIVTMFVIQNSEGDILLQKRDKQPYINCWTLPYGKTHLDDASLELAAKRELAEKVGGSGFTPEHAGECYIRVWHHQQILSCTLVHVFRLYTDEVVQTERLQWARPHKISQLRLAPAVEEIMARTFFKDAHFFEEFDIAW